MTAPLEPARILVVDDHADSRTLVSAHLQRLGHEVVAAGSAAEALATLQSAGCERFAAVATDYWMPGGTGLDLLRRTRPVDPTLAFLIITADSERRIVADTLRSGGCDCLVKPVDGPRLRESIARAIAQTREQRRQRAVVQSARTLGQNQLHLLERHTAAAGGRIARLFHSQAEASGDFVSVFPLGDDRFALFASDAAGHDLRAAFQSNYFHGLARGMMEHGASIPEVLAQFNRLLLRDWNAERVDYSLATFAACVDLRRQTLEAINCGFPRPCLSDAAGWAEPLPPEIPGSPLGWFEAVPAATSCRIAGGCLCFWSDGLASLAERLEVDPLSLSHRLLRASDGVDRDALLAAADDDLATLRFDLSLAGGAAPAWPIFHQRHVAADLAAIAAHHDFFERSLRLALPGFREETLLDAIVATQEALLNALRHGCGRRAAARATLQAALRADGRALHIRVTDDGPGHDFDLDSHETAAACQLIPRHRGLILMRNLASRITSAARGADVIMEFDA